MMKLSEINSTYGIEQVNGQRVYWGPARHTAPPRGSEIFVGKLPRDLLEDELIPLFSNFGSIHKLRLMMDFSGNNRGFAFVKYSSPSEARQAVCCLNGHCIRPDIKIGVTVSLDNATLIVKNIPEWVEKERIKADICGLVEGLKEIKVRNMMKASSTGRYALLEFWSHHAASQARRVLIPRHCNLWDGELTIDWAEPNMEEIALRMQLKTLFVNGLTSTDMESIKAIFYPYQVAHIKFTRSSFAYVSFDTYSDASAAFKMVQSSDEFRRQFHVKWARFFESNVGTPVTQRFTPTPAVPMQRMTPPQSFNPSMYPIQTVSAPLFSPPMSFSPTFSPVHHPLTLNEYPQNLSALEFYQSSSNPDFQSLRYPHFLTTPPRVLSPMISPPSSTSSIWRR